jgi:hypothetical protein
MKPRTARSQPVLEDVVMGEDVPIRHLTALPKTSATVDIRMRAAVA